MSLDFSELRVRDYSKFFLADNPFPSITVPEENPVTPVDRDSVLKSIREVVVAAVTSGKSQTLVITGTYGSGKSHILKFARNRINSQLGSIPDKRTIAVYVENPRSYFKEFYSEAIASLGQTFVKDLVRNIVLQYMFSNSSELESFLIDKGKKGETVKNLILTLSSKPESLEDLFSKGTIRHGDLLHRVKKSHENKFRLRDYLEVAFQLLNSGFESSSWRWLSAERITRTEKGELRVLSEVEEENALDAFHDLRVLFRLGGFNTLVILLDELERITELHKSLESRYFDDLRRFIDNNTEGICLIACVTPTAVAEIHASGHPLERRLLANTDRLDPFDIPLTTELIKAYIARSRNSLLEQQKLTFANYKNTIQAKQAKADAELFPFAGSVVQSIHEFTGGNIGYTLLACRKLLDEACDRKVETVDDLAFVSSVLKT